MLPGLSSPCRLLLARTRGPGVPTSSTGKAAGIEDPAELAQAVRDAVAAGLIYRRVDDDFVLLTEKGRGVTAD